MVKVLLIALNSILGGFWKAIKQIGLIRYSAALLTITATTTGLLLNGVDGMFICFGMCFICRSSSPSFELYRLN